MADNENVKRERWKPDGHKWEMSGTPDGWPMAHIPKVGGGVRLRLCHGCGEMHDEGPLPPACLAKLQARAEREESIVSEPKGEADGHSRKPR